MKYIILSIKIDEQDEPELYEILDDNLVDYELVSSEEL